MQDIVERLRGPGISDYELDLGISRDAVSEIMQLRQQLAICTEALQRIVTEGASIFWAQRTAQTALDRISKV